MKWQCQREKCLKLVVIHVVLIGSSQFPVLLSALNVMAFEEEFNTEIPDEVAEKIRTVKDAVDLLDKK